MSAGYRIGDVVPMPPGADRAQALYIQAQRGKIARNAQSPMQNKMTRAARKIMASHADRIARAADPVEQAKGHLVRRGYTPVCRMETGAFLVGSLRFDNDDEVMDFARRKGWAG